MLIQTHLYHLSNNNPISPTCSLSSGDTYSIVITTLNARLEPLEGIEISAIIQMNRKFSDITHGSTDENGNFTMMVDVNPDYQGTLVLHAEVSSEDNLWIRSIQEKWNVEIGVDFRDCFNDTSSQT